MAKRGRKKTASGISIDSLMAELGQLDARRAEISLQVRSALSALSGVFNTEVKPMVDEVSASVAKAVKGTRKKMSAEARGKIAAAQKLRWAKVRTDAEKAVKSAAKGAKKTAKKAVNKATKAVKG
jgi:hypothetical protein